MALSLDVQIPEHLKTTLELAGYSPETLSREARRTLAAYLYTRNILTLAQAAELADMPVREFIPFLAGMGLPVINYPPDELAHDIESIEWQIQER
ncbi:MAG: UPF0175 family protein [Fimbriimonadales bacterium]|nr:UPF0175 family protein [Armatimonadota bacterium]MCX7686451.1 UPF0175 family protein [Fimbriimonadales bacterium]GBC90034.1 hypothetical protein HRbin14_00766 [bacterium HR14]CUU35431.1 Uncharacterised protein family (UPF0175) [Armatimonadetes bacterium DC]